MAVRSINLKMVLPRGNEGQGLRASLWLTHSVTNHAVAQIEGQLILCRGAAYSTEQGIVSCEQVRGATLEMARRLQSARGVADCGTDAEVLSLLRQLYEEIVPAVLLDDDGNPRPGSAQTAGAFAGPLMDASSKGFMSVFDKVLDPPPEWIAKMKENVAGWECESVEWLASDDAGRLQRASGSPPAWVRRLRASQPWQSVFADDQATKRAQAGGRSTLIQRLKQLGLLPIMEPPINSRLRGRKPGLTPWDRLALRLAVAHLLSWESWNHRAAVEHRRVADRLDQQRELLLPFAHFVDELRQYEADRHEELKRVALADDERPFRITMRMLRAWDRVRELWIGQAGLSQASRIAALAELQRKMSGRFGDPDLFRWLGIEGREHLWNVADPLPELARFNALERLLARKKSSAAYTAPDPQLHPRWSLFEAPGGSNLRNYHLRVIDGSISVDLPLLTRVGDSLVDSVILIRLAPSGQMEAPQLIGDSDEASRLHFRSAHQDSSAEIGGAELLFLRRHLENRKFEELEAGAVGPVWLKLVMEVDSQAPPAWLDGRGRLATPATVNHFKTGLATRSRHMDGLAPGLRVLSVDLGLRCFACCSVFELVAGEPQNRLAFLADETRNLWARHERSFVLPLPGEMPDRKAIAARRAADDEMGALRRGLSRLKTILRLSVREGVDDRRTALDELRADVDEELSRATEPTLGLADILPLEQYFDCPAPRWQAETTKVYRNIEAILAERVGSWRRRTRKRDTMRRAHCGGKSAWAIGYLERVRRLLLGWSLRGKEYGEINRMNRQQRGTFAGGLLEHIAAIKDDRIKTGSDRIVQAARGYVPGEIKGWVRQFEPCRLILFEDLARYRFRTDRPRRENSQLMRWCHRRIVSETTMQAELYGILVDTTGAGFSSRFHARTGAPGCRARILSTEDLTSESIQRQLELLAESLSIKAESFRPGLHLPWEGGEDFATLSVGGTPVIIHADLNAAQNLQRRFWTRHRDAYRLSAVAVSQGDQSYWYPDSEGVRIRGAVAALVGGDGYARLKPSDDGDGLILEKLSKSLWKKVIGGDAAADEEAIDELDVELVEAMGDFEVERGRKKQVFFRDPSGLVLRPDRWYKAKEFWGRVRGRTARALGIA